MQNYLGSGDVLRLSSAPAPLNSGQGLLVGAMFGIVLASVAEGQPYVLWLRGIYQLPKNAAEVWSCGVVIYWDNINLVATIMADTNTKIGVASAAAANPSNFGNVRLNGAF